VFYKYNRTRKTGNKMSSTAHFKIEYDGPALKNHEIDIRDLAPALLALTDLFDESNRIINGDTTKAVVKIKAPFKEGSFGVDLSLVHVWTKNIADMFSTKEASASANLLAYTLALMQLVKWLKNRVIDRIVKKNDKESEVITRDGDSIIIVNQALNLFQSVNIRNSLEKTIKNPLCQEGINRFGLTSSLDRKTLVVDRSERDYFAVPSIPDTLIEEIEYEKTVQIVSVSFEEGYKWRFSDGQSFFTADICDEDFINRVKESREIFRKDDIMKVRIKSKQFSTSQGLKSEIQILRVIEHRSAAQQIELPYKHSGHKDKKK
jgi:hypothetical protein